MAQNNSPLRDLTSGPSLFDKVSVAPQISAEEQYKLTNSDNEFTRGLRSGAAGLSAGSFANQALSQEASGDADWERNRELALQTHQRGEMYAPRVSSLRQVGSMSDLGDFAAGAVGQGAMSMAPTLGAALLTRGRGRWAAPTAFAGAAVPAYALERGEAALGQYSDPALAKASVEDRDLAATAKGAVNAGLESIVPASLGASFLRKPAGSFLGHVGREALTEGLTEAAQQAVGFGAEKYLDPNRQLDAWDIADAAAAGALTGGGVSAATRAPAHLLEGVEKNIPEPTPVIEEPTKPKDYVTDTVDKMAEASQDSATPADFLRRVFGDPTRDALDPILLGDNDPTLAGATPEETEANILKRDQDKVVRAQEFATQLLNDDKTPDDVKQRITDMQNDFSNPENQSFVANTLMAQTAVAKANDAIDGLAEMAKKFSARAKTAFDEGVTALQDKVIKQNLQDTTPQEQAAFDKIIFNNLTEEAQSNPAIRKRIPELANAMLAFAARTGDLNKSDLATLGKVQDAMDLFQDPDQVAAQLTEYAGLPRLEDSFLSRIKSISSAQQDVRQPNSFLFSALSEDAKDNLNDTQLKSLARVVDNFAQFDEQGKGDAVLAGLTAAFGSADTARSVLDYYQKQNGTVTAFDPSEGSTTEKEGAPAPTYQFADPKTMRPFRSFAGQSINDGGMRRRVREATLAGSQLKKNTTADVRPIKMSQYAAETGANPDVELKRIETDIQGRIKQHELRKDEDRSEQINKLKGELELIKQTKEVGGTEQALDLYEVLQVSGQEKNETVATDDELSKYGKLADNTDARDTRITFRRTDGSKLTLSAESMWKSKGDAEGAGKGENAQTRAKRLFSDAVASVLARPEIEAVVTPLDKVTVDRGLQLQAKKKPNPEYRAMVTASLKAAEGSLKTLSSTLDSVIEEYADAGDKGSKKGESASRRDEIEETLTANIAQLTERLDAARGGSGPLADNMPAQAVAREKLRMYRDAQNQIEAVKFDEEYTERDENRSGIPGAGQDAGPVGPNKLNRTRANEELANPGTRYSEEDTGLGVGVEKRAKRESSMNPKAGRRGKVDAQAILDEVSRIRGKDVKVLFRTFASIGASGEFSMNKDKTNRLIKIAINSINPMSVAWHESLHDFMAMLGGDKSERQLKKDLLDAAEAPHVMRQLKELLKGHPNALKQIESDKEERLAYMYQFWAEGALRLGPTASNIFTRALKFFRDMLGVLGKDEKIQTLLEALHTGKFADPNLVASTLEDLKAETLGERVRKAAGPIAEGANAIFTSATDRLRNTNVDALEELADMFHRETDREKGQLPFLQQRSQTVGKYLNRIQKLLENTNATDRRAALENMQKMQSPSTPLESELSKLFADLHAYMTASGVKRFNPATKKWEAFRTVQNYFPRNWDKDYIRNHEAQFIDTMKQYIGQNQARATYNAIVNGDGTLELNENPHHLGYTPFANAVQDRKFDFIKPNNVSQFTQFLNKDLTDTLTTYVQQAVHRAEYASTFGNAGEVIQEKLKAAKEQGATTEEIQMANKAVMAMEGTLGHDFNPRLKELMSGIMTYQNIVLLPLALFSSLIDPLGVAMRSNDMKEAGKAFLYGMQGIAKALTGGKQDEKEEMAKLLGIIDEQNMLEAMGQVYNSMHMSKFMKNINNKFFRYNGMELWNRRMRVAAMMAAQRFIVRNITNQRYMDELGIDKGDVFENKDGTIALTAEQLESDHGVSKSDAAKIEKKIQAAVFKFVDGGVLRPNAAHRPIWGSDPRFQLIFHLKQFTYSFHNTILRRVGEEMKHGNVAPAWILASYIPFMLAADLMKGSLTGTLKTNLDLFDYLSQSVARSGIMGLGVFGTDATGDIERGKIPGSSFLGPSFDHLMTLLSGIFGNTSATQVIERSIPAGAALRGVI